MEKRELTCIGCPLGCAITVTLEGGKVKEVAGFKAAADKKIPDRDKTE